MEQVIQFFMDHWVVSSLFILLILIFIFNELRNRTSGIVRLNPQGVVNLINHKKGVVLDLRSKEIFEQGHILGSINIPLKDLQQSLAQCRKFKDRPIILTSEAGENLTKVATNLKNQGFNQLHQLVGGITAWKSEGLPLTED